jgi:NADH-quinone oxidoreductase subunit C
MTDQEQPPREPEQGESKGPARPPPTSGPPPMTATRARLLASRGQAQAQPAQPPERATPPADVASEAQARPAPPPEERPAGEAAPEAASESVEAAAEAPARPAPATRPGGPAAAARPAAAPGTAARPAASPAARPAAAAAAPEPDPEEVVRLREALPELQWKRAQGYLELNIPKQRLLEVAQWLRDDLEYDYLSSVTAVDWLDRIEIVYHLYSFNYYKRPSAVVLRVDLERPEYPEYPLCPSLTKLWPGAGFQEREVYDLMGVKFVGHPDLRRILLADDFPGHPLRKDFEFDYEYVLVRHLSYGVEGQFETPTYGSRSLP